MAPSIEVSEAMLRAGAEILCHNHSALAGDEDAWRLYVDEARSIYLAMQSKSHPQGDELLRRFVEIIDGTDTTGFYPRVEQMLMDLAEESRAALVRSKPDDVLSWLGENVGLELSWGELDNDLSECGWRVHKRHGGINDREWDLISTGETPRAALDAAALKARATLQGEVK